MSRKFKLTIELVPKTSWCKNLRKEMKKPAWDRLRKRTYAEYNHKCGICGSEERLNCHEIWKYDDQNHIQKLDGFIALCWLCHHVKHIGLARVLANRGELNFDMVVEHFLKVNQCGVRDFERHKKKALIQWAERSKHEWEVDLGEYQSLVRNNN